MKRAVAILIAMTVTCLAYAAPAIPQRSDARPAMTLTTAERRAVDLQQGMKAKEVERLLGKPKRTSLRQGGLSSTADPAMGGLQWTYTWPAATERDGTLQVVFARESSGEWLVDSWGWDTTY